MKTVDVRFPFGRGQNKAASPHRGTGRGERRKRAASWAFLAPSLLGSLLFFFAPFGVVVRYSLINNPVQKEFVGAANYVSVWKNAAFQKALGNTFRFSVCAVPLAVVLSLLFAVLLMSRIPMKSRFRSAMLSPLMVPVASIVLIWQILFGYNGLVNAVTAQYGMDKIDWLKSQYAQLPVILLFIWKNLGYNMILFMSALASIPAELTEVARLETAGRLKIFFMIKLRYLSPTILFVTVMSIINSFKVFREVYLLTGNYPFDPLYMLQHYMNNMFRNLDYQKLSAAAVILSAFMVVLIGLLFGVEDYFGKDIEGT